MLTLPDETVALLAVAAVGFRTPDVALRHATGSCTRQTSGAPPPLTAEPAPSSGRAPVCESDIIRLYCTGGHTVGRSVHRRSVRPDGCLTVISPTPPRGGMHHMHRGVP